jgi:predicted outer membrane repeat protein
MVENPKSGASTSSAIPACFNFKYLGCFLRNFSKSGGGAMASGGELTVRVIALQ